MSGSGPAGSGQLSIADQTGPADDGDLHDDLSFAPVARLALQEGEHVDVDLVLMRRGDVVRRGRVVDVLGVRTVLIDLLLAGEELTRKRSPAGRRSYPWNFPVRPV
jgi:hypothetical protein